jgi:hypothetical protein
MVAMKTACHTSRGLSTPLEDTSSKDSELVQDQLAALMETEQFYRVRAIPCKAQVGETTGRIPLEDWRRKICQWAFRVIDHFRLDREVVSVGMNIFDRFLVEHETPRRDEFGAYSPPRCCCPSCKRSVDSRTYQLAAMTAIFISVKANANNGAELPSGRKQFKLSTFVELSRGQFQIEDITLMERTVLDTIRWKVSPPTPVTFVSYLLTLMPGRELMPSAAQTHYDLSIHVLRELSRYLTELSACLGESCSYHSPSRVAFAAILVSMDLLTPQALPLQVRDAFRQAVFQVCGMSSHHQYGPIPHLKSALERALWPEMLLDGTDHHSSDAGHPISIARHYGLLDLDRIYRAQRQSTTFSSIPSAGHTPPGSPKLDQGRSSALEVSPVSVAR